MFKKNSVIVVFMVFVSVLPVFLLDMNKISYYEITGVTMGTTYSIKIPAFYDKKQVSPIKKKVEKRLNEINHLFSVFLTNSEISKLNRHGASKPFEASKELFSLISRAKEISVMTNGAFDITIGVLVNYWGFGKDTKKIEQMPDKKEIDSILQNIGYEKFSLDRKNNTISKLNENLYFDLSAIAKGYGVDEIKNLLYQNKIKDFMLEIGGEIFVAGYKDEKKQNKWTIAIKNIDKGFEETIVSMTGKAVATSGDYENFFMFNDKRYSHEIDPKTGYPKKHNLASVTVFGDNCADADAFATALMVMGEKKGFSWAEKNNIKAIFYTRGESGNIKTIATKKVRNLLKDKGK